MAKQDSPCMFCGGLPCACDGGLKKKSSRSTRKVSSRKTSSEAGVASVPSASVTEESTEDVFGAIPEPDRPKFKSKPTSERDLSLESALRNIRSIVCPKDQRRIDKELARNYPQEVDRRMSDWRGRHGD